MRIRFSLSAAAFFVSSSSRGFATGLSSSRGATTPSRRVVRIAEDAWRRAAEEHQQRIHGLLKPGMIPWDHPNNAANRKQSSQRNNPHHHSQHDHHEWTALDPKHPTFNFLIEYYNLKGRKGPKLLARWSPSVCLLRQPVERIETPEELAQASSPTTTDPAATAPRQQHHTGILLEGATEDDFASLLHLRGAVPHYNDDDEHHPNDADPCGMVYSPSSFFGRDDPSRQPENEKSITPFLWYRSILEQTLSAEPILHCFGLHEWAMQYHPEGAPPPPSAKYQAHLPLRVSRQTINETVERKGVSCTHVDALRFFAPAAAPLNHHGASLQRTDQLRLEQPACVHAHMDLLKIALKLRPFLSAGLLCDVLAIALEARALDVSASPYDATAYGLGVVPIETADGRAQYRREQKKLMEKAELVRRNLLAEYQAFLPTAFSETTLRRGGANPLPERFAKAEPGGLPWRKNLIAETASQP